jgi:lysophospholipid acyltransferase (LPLAT)-like uncharacterized protein
MDRLKYKWREVRPRLVSGLLHGLLRSICSTVRIRLIGDPYERGPAIYCGYHGRSFLFANYFRKRGYWVIISQSNDGEMQTRIFRRLGYQIIRGSTGRGGARAAVEAIRVLRKGETMAMTPDGPRGPTHIIQPGVITMAQRSGAALIPTGITSKPRIFAKSWDSYLIPVPFGKGVILFGDPIFVPENATDEELEACRLKLQEECNRVELEADTHC